MENNNDEKLKVGTRIITKGTSLKGTIEEVYEVYSISLDNYKHRTPYRYTRNEFDILSPSFSPKFEVGDLVLYDSNKSRILQINPELKFPYLIHVLLTNDKINVKESQLEEYVEDSFKVGDIVEIIDFDRSMSSLYFFHHKMCRVVGKKENGSYKLELFNEWDKSLKVNESDTAKEFIKSIQWPPEFLKLNKLLNEEEKKNKMKEDVILGQCECPNCGTRRDTALNKCICGYNPKTGKVEDSPLNDLSKKRNPKKLLPVGTKIKYNGDLFEITECRQESYYIVKFLYGPDPNELHPINLSVDANIQVLPQELNLYELFERVAQGKEFYSPAAGKIKFVRIKPVTETLLFQSRGQIEFTKEGYLSLTGNNLYCLLFPSEELYLKYPTNAWLAWYIWREELENSVVSIELKYQFVGRRVENNQTEEVKSVLFSSMEEAEKAMKKVERILLGEEV